MKTLPLTDQVCSLELAKQLHDLKVPQESLFYWYRSQREGWFVGSREDGLFDENGKSRDGAYSAFTVAELGEMLRQIIPQMRNIVVGEHRERIRQLIKRVQVSWENEKELEDRAKMLIYLLQNKLITL